MMQHAGAQAVFGQVVAEPVQGVGMIVLGALLQPLQGIFGPQEDQGLHVQDFLQTPEVILNVVLTKPVIEPQGMLQKVFAVSNHGFILTGCNGSRVKGQAPKGRVPGFLVRP
jgi:hypothetical protein